MVIFYTDVYRFYTVSLFLVLVELYKFYTVIASQCVR
jgi:hypothetical protein